ncbi:MAG: hypothetical protein ACKERG_04085 [Candidatus Hodgkinia cicadicola]
MGAGRRGEGGAGEVEEGRICGRGVEGRLSGWWGERLAVMFVDVSRGWNRLRA